MQTQGFYLQENSPTGMQSRPSAKGICQKSTTVERGDGHMDQVPNPIRPTTNYRSFLSISYYSKHLKRGDSILYRLALLLDFFSHQPTMSPPKRLVTVESHSSYAASTEGRQSLTTVVLVTSTNSLYALQEILTSLKCCFIAVNMPSTKQCNYSHMYSLKVSPLYIPIWVYLYCYIL